MAALREQSLAAVEWARAGGEVLEDPGPVPAMPAEDTYARQRKTAVLARTVELEVIPRLLLGRRARLAVAAATVPAAKPTAQIVSGEDVVELANLVLGRQAELAASFVDAFRSRGTAVDTLYLDLLAPTARRLGEMWTEDLCNFTAVTIGLLRLQHVLRELSPAFQIGVAPSKLHRRALLVPSPGDQHTFGLAMVAEFFRRAGWQVWAGAPASHSEFIGMVRAESFEIVGFSVSNERRLDALAGCIRAIRRASRNRTIGVMVGGPIFTDHPEFVALVGADATAVDGRQAAAQAEGLLGLLAAPR